MATVTRRKNGVWEIRFFIAPNQRRSFYPGKATKKQAESIGVKLDKLAFASGQSEPPPPDVAEWIVKLSAKHHKKLAEWGLVSPRRGSSATPTVAEWSKRQRDKKRHAATRDAMTTAVHNLTTYFGEERLVSEVTPGDAEEYRIWLETEARIVGEGEPVDGLAHNTVRRRIGRAKEIFNAAVKHRLIADNPFADEKAAVGTNVKRQYFVPQSWIERCIKAAPCEDWRIIIALARYGGLRSHETRIQVWDDIDIPNRRMIVHSNKSPPERVCPIFPELLPHLLRAKEMAADGAVQLQTRYQVKSCIGTTFEKIIAKAGLVRWPKLMQNLRATRETELMAKYPTKDVAAWLGNSEPVAMKHYAMEMEESFERAKREGASDQSLVRQIVRHSVTPHGTKEPIDSANESRETIIVCEGTSLPQSGSPTRTTNLFRNIGKDGDSEFGTPDSTPDETRLVFMFRHLRSETRADVLSLIEKLVFEDSVEIERPTQTPLRSI